MKKLYSQFTRLSFILLSTVGAMQGMEISVTRRMPSLQRLCLDYIGNNPQQINLLDNLAYLPSDLAIETIFSLNDKTYGMENKAKFVELALSNTLDINVSSEIAAKLLDSTLAYQIAKNGSITKNAAFTIVYHFIKKTDFNDFLIDLNSGFSKAFPQEILYHGDDHSNYDCLYRSLISYGIGYSAAERINKNALPSLQQMACLSYFYYRLTDISIFALCKTIIYNDSIDGNLKKMLEFIENNNIVTTMEELFPEKVQYFKTSIKEIKEVDFLNESLNTISKLLNMTKKELLIKFIIDNDQELIIKFINIIDNFDEDTQRQLYENLRYHGRNIIYVLNDQTTQ